MANEVTALWKVRKFGEKPGDLELVNGWRKAHKAPEMPGVVVPPLALIAEKDGEPQAFGVLYQSYEVGVCFAEWFTARPGLRLAETALAIGHVLQALFEMTKETHRLVLGYASPVVARMLERYGFERGGSTGIQVVKLIE